MITEAEYVVASDVAKEALWLNQLASMFPSIVSNFVATLDNDSQCSLVTATLWASSSMHYFDSFLSSSIILENEILATTHK